MYASYIALGSNVGQRAENLKTAVKKLKEKKNRVVLSSHIYRTAPYGEVEQDDFYNAVIGILTPYKPRALLNILKTVESEMGREDIVRWGPRIIDLDIILFGKEIVNTPGLTIPHPDFRNRLFVLKPLMEIGYMIEDPETGKTIEAIYSDLVQEKGEDKGILEKMERLSI